MSTILVGVDGSAESTKAAQWAAKTAEVEGAGLKIVAAYTTTTSDYAPGLVIPQDVIDAIRDEASGIVQEAANAAREVAPEVSLSGSIVEGDASRVLLELGEEADMIVIGTRGLGGLKGLLLGSVSTNVAAHSKGKVVVLTDSGGDGPVVVGVEQSPVSDAAVAEAFRQAALRNTKLVAVHTWTPLDADALHGYGLDPEEIEQMSQQAVESVGERLGGYAEDYPDVEVERVVIPEEPSKAILDAAGNDAQLIVVGSRGRGGFKGLLLGSNSQKIMNQAHAPVMVVRG